MERSWRVFISIPFQRGDKRFLCYSQPLFAAGRIRGATAQRILFVKRKFDPSRRRANRGMTFTVAYLLPLSLAD